ncbi:hypothetical protein PYW08_004671 [Mythimna loreyi]|uniref:Uncharacterized protein n=1 Tax=Mythimna loreyi TaxID=667449 RepID=A0ACC2QRS6_9NEOP|nr:hypothetical protein PYW08_004671 [Mythimna loreyi]
MNTLRYGLVFLAVVTVIACIVIYELRYSKVSDSEKNITNGTIDLLKEEKYTDLENAATNGTLFQQRGEENSDLKNVTLLEKSEANKRIKKHIMNNGKCPEGFIELKVFGKLLCLPCDKYSEGNDC